MARKFLDITGERYGRLVALKIERREGKRTFWRFKCDCGNEVVCRIDTVRAGRSRSCGCYDRDVKSRLLRERNLKSPGYSCFTILYHGYVRSAKDRNIGWDLTKEQVKSFFESPCHYCGIGPSRYYYKQGMNGAFKYNGIDRVNNSRGYSEDNCVSCCSHCNYAKRDMTLGEFTEWVTRLAEHWVGKGRYQDELR